MTVDIGDLERLGNPSQDTSSAAFTNLAGLATDPTAVTLDVQKPDGSMLRYGWPSPGPDGLLTKEATGRFYRDVSIDQSGTWRFRLAGTGAVQAASESSFRVQRQRVP
jgi:hypothetical protein